MSYFFNYIRIFAYSMGNAKYFLMIVGVLFSSLSFANDYLSEAKQRVEYAIHSNFHWNGPVTGPAIVSQKSIIFVGSDLRNGGVNAVAKGLSEAIAHTEWTLKFLDGHGSAIRQGAALRDAVGYQPDGIVLCGINAKSHEDVLRIAKKLGITVVGWHATNEAKSLPEIGLFTNITTDPKEVAAIAALLAIVDSQGKAKVVIFTDPNYSIAELKAQEMGYLLKQCKDCDILSVENIPLGEIAQQMPRVLQNLLSRHINTITHILVINDLYIDYAIPSLEFNNNGLVTLPVTISAGDGSRAAYKRISQGYYQLATVPEPLYLHGWQIVDEFNRAFHGEEPSGYSAPVHLVTQENVNELLGGRVDVYDPQNGYRDAYLRIWNKQ